jgi:hypothetical protein
VSPVRSPIKAVLKQTLSFSTVEATRVIAALLKAPNLAQERSLNETA